MKVYLAAMFRQQAMIKEHAIELTKLGVEVTSRWLDEVPNDPSSMSRSRHMREMAFIDAADIRNADVFVLFTQEPTTPTVRGGRHWETGYAYALGKPVLLVGPRENIFHYLPNVDQVDTWQEVLSFFAPIAESEYFAETQ